MTMSPHKCMLKEDRTRQGTMSDAGDVVQGHERMDGDMTRWKIMDDDTTQWRGRTGNESVERMDVGLAIGMTQHE